jgi:MFS family permease
VSSGRTGTDFARDRLTWLVYGMAGIFGYAVAALGPVMPLFRKDLGISRTLGGLHFTIVAVGAVVFGSFVDRLARRWGRRRLLWSGGAGVVVGALLIGLGRHPAVTLLGAALIGGPGAALLAAVQSTLADSHAAHRGVALTEANTATSIGAALPALVIGGFVAIGLGWRLAFAVPTVLFLVVLTTRRNEPFPALAPGRSYPRRLPRAYWWFWAGLLPAVGAEWSVAAWGASYLVDVGGTSEGVASVLMTSFFGTMALGRFLTSRLARHVAPLPLLLIAAAVGLGGLLTFWLVETATPIVVGLLLIGLGISALFPMLLTMAMSTAPDRSETAAARVSIAAGTAVIVAPLTLGFVADQSSLQTAFGFVPGLLVIVAALALAGEFVARRTDLR